MATESGLTPLVYALGLIEAPAGKTCDRPAMLRRLLAAGADVRATNADGQTPLIVAAFMGRLDTLEVLLEVLLEAGGEDLDAEDGSGINALGYAIIEGHPEVAARLRAAGAGPPAFGAPF